MKKESPAIATEGFAKSQAFVEYILKQAPGVFDQVKDFVKDYGTDVLDLIKQNAPIAFAGAQKAGEAVAHFVAENGPQVLDGIGSVGGSVIKFLSNNHPKFIDQAMPEVAAGASVAGEGASVAASEGLEGAQAVGKLAAKGVSSLISAGLPDLSTIGKVAAQGASIVADHMPGALATAAGALGTAANAVGNVVGNIDAAVVGDVAAVAMNIIGTGAAAFPFLLPLQIAVRDIGMAVQQATYNKE